MCLTKIYVFEMVTALGLWGIVHLYLAVEADPLVVHSRTLAQLTVLYLLIAMASESMIVSSLRPSMLRALGLNILVAVVVLVAGWTSPASLKMSSTIAVATLILRVLVAAVSLHTPLPLVRRFTAAGVGVPLLTQTLLSIYVGSESLYYDYYFYPKVKVGYIMPARWQDFAARAGIWTGIILMMYLSYWLLKYACHRRYTLTA